MFAAQRETGRFDASCPLTYLRCLVIALSLLALNACSVVEVAYNQADVIAAFQLDQYFDLSEAQADDADRRLKAIFAWHRHEQLPDYAEFLTEARARFERGLTTGDVEWFIDGLKTRYQAVAVRLSDDAAEFLAALEDRQIAHLRATLEAKNRELRQEWYLDEPVERQASRQIERILGRVEDWTGALTDTQRRQVEPLWAGLPLTGRQRYDERLRRQQEFLELLQARADGPVFRSRLRDWLLAWEQGRAPEYQRTLDALRNKSIAWIVRLDRLLTPRQRSHVAARLDEILGVIRALTRIG
ncbi:MAG: DUF6279 family lipoprotein [Methylotetracoccus sp.]|jgi:hypothetical protein|nr:DUF6279 family lipoprotein [Methylotetracoccus sp.]